MVAIMKRGGVVRRVGLLSLTIIASFAYLASESVDYGDGPYYAHDIYNLLLIDPGHLLWRPLGALIYSVAYVFGYRGDILWILQAISFLASVGSVLATYSFLSRWTTPIVSLWGASILAFSNGFWGYSVSGSSYSAGLLFTILAITLAAPPRHRRQSVSRTVVAAVSGGMSALFWLPYGLLFPILLGLVAVSIGNEAGSDRVTIMRHLGLFLVSYGVTVGLPLVGCYLFLPLLAPHAVKLVEFQTQGFLGWLASSSHGNPPRYGFLQVLKWIFGWAQSVIAFGGFGQAAKLWILDGVELKWSSIVMGFVALLSFYGLLGYGLFKFWLERRVILRASYKPILLLGLCTFLLNSVFAFYWQATDPERYLPSLPFLVLVLAIAVDLERNAATRTVMMALSLLVVMSVNWSTAIYPAINPNSFKNQWLMAIREHLDKVDLLIVLGAKKYKLIDPHNPGMPKINNVSENVLTNPSSPEAYKVMALNDIQETRERGGHVFIGDSVFGVNTAPRDGWSFRENPVPSPKELDDLFSPMKGEFAFAVNGERVWRSR